MPDTSSSDPSSDPATSAATQQQLMNLLEMLAGDAPVGAIAASTAPPRARELALQISNLRDVHRQREAGLSALLDTARELATESEPGQVLEAIVRRARILLGTDLAYLTLYDPAAGDTFMRATDGSVSAVFQSVRLALGAGLGGLVASTHKPYWTADYWSDERFKHTAQIDGAVGEEGIVAICGTPLIVESDFVGVLFAANRTIRPFTREEVALLGNLATLAAVTLVQTRALNDAERALEGLSEAHETVQQYALGVEKAAEAHDRFAALVLHGGGVDDLTHALGELLGGWAVLFDDQGHRRSSFGPAPEVAAGIDPLATVLDLKELASGRLIDVESDGQSYQAISVTAAKTQLGILCTGGFHLEAGSDRRTIERAALVTALVLLFERNAVDSLQSARNRIMADLVSGRGSVAERAQLARDAGLSSPGPWCLLAIRAEDRSTERALILSVANALGDGSLVGSIDGDVFAVTPSVDPDSSAKSLAQRLGRKACVTVAGVGPLTDVSEIADAHDEGVRTVSALIALGHTGIGAAATQLGFAGLIVGSTPDVNAYVERILGPVLEYDERRGTDLEQTLAAYFAAGSSPRHAAGALHVHVNTVSQRLDRIGSLLGSNWQSPEQTLEIQLALRLRALLRR